MTREAYGLVVILGLLAWPFFVCALWEMLRKGVLRDRIKEVLEYWRNT